MLTVQSAVRGMHARRAVLKLWEEHRSAGVVQRHSRGHLARLKMGDDTGDGPGEDLGDGPGDAPGDAPSGGPRRRGPGVLRAATHRAARPRACRR